MKRYNLINTVINSINAKSYLELGHKKGATFKNINCAHKESVDIDKNSDATHIMTTDEFFKQNKKKFDVIFIDACHHHDYVMRDFKNSLSILNYNGRIIMHDCWPISRGHESLDGCGTTWRAFVHIKSQFNVDTITANFDHGISILKLDNKKEKLVINKSMDELTYDDLCDNLSNWINPQNKIAVVDWVNS